VKNSPSTLATIRAVAGRGRAISNVQMYGNIY
jgi:hypothetical protein